MQALIQPVKTEQPLPAIANKHNSESLLVPNFSKLKRIEVLNNTFDPISYPEASADKFDVILFVDLQFVVQDHSEIRFKFWAKDILSVEPAQRARG